MAALEQPQPVEASLLALELLTPDADDLRLKLLGRIKDPSRAQLRAEIAAIIAHANRPDLITTYLRDDEWLDAGLCLARWCPPFGVLRAVIELEPPKQPHQQAAYALALGLGDREALHLNARAD